MPYAPDVTALILAGGRSRRFGRDKAAVPVEGRPMIVRVFEAVAPLVAEVRTSVRAPGGRGPAAGCEEVVDRYPDAGPLAGLHAGLRRSTHPWLLAVACDLPFLTPDALCRLLAARHDRDVPIVAATPDGRRHPLCALYPASALGAVEAALEAGRLRLHDLLAATGAVDVPVPAEPLRNVNRPADLDGDL